MAACGVKVHRFVLEVPRRGRFEVRKIALAADEGATVSTAGGPLVIALGADRIVFAATEQGWSSPRFEPGGEDNEAALLAIQGLVRAFGGRFEARVDRDGRTEDVAFEAPQGGGDAPALWAARRVLAEVVRVSSTDASAALLAISSHPCVTRPEVATALGGEADRVWAALEREGLVKPGGIPSRALYIWVKKQE